jgi:hypothetical protein
MSTNHALGSRDEDESEDEDEIRLRCAALDDSWAEHEWWRTIHGCRIAGFKVQACRGQFHDFRRRKPSL